MPQKIHLMRHFESAHNQRKAQHKLAHPNTNHKTTPDYQSLKYDRSLVDPSIRELTEPPPYDAAYDQVRTIICSPLTRCLQTCRILSGIMENEPKVIVEPLLSSRFDSAWSVGSNTHYLQQSFPKYDFSAFKGQEDSWMLEILQNSVKFREVSREMEVQDGSECILELLKAGRIEDYPSFVERASRLRHKLAVQLQEEKGDVLIIGHSCSLNFLLGGELDSRGKVRNKISFKHGTGHTFSLEELVSGNALDLRAK